MKLLHQIWHNKTRNYDALFNNWIWDWLIFTAYSIKEEYIWKPLWQQKITFNSFASNCFLDLQYYWDKGSKWGCLATYDFHPINNKWWTTLASSDLSSIEKWVNYQISKWFKNIIIPHAYYSISDNFNKIIDIIEKSNRRILEKRIEWLKYYMTLPISENILSNKDFINELLLRITDININFDWYYIIIESSPKYKQKINNDYPFYENVYKILRTLKQNWFELIYAYANFNSLVFCSLMDIDYISIWTYENLRNFNIKRFTEDTAWWPSDWWYFSEKLLNMIKAKEIAQFRKNWVIDKIKNENNIFSDTILTDWYIRNTHKPEVHKNYLLSISRLLKELSEIKERDERKKFFLWKIEKARSLYAELYDLWVRLFDESSDYFLSTWRSFLESEDTL